MSNKAPENKEEVPVLAAGAEADKAQTYRHKAFPFVRRGTIYGFPLAEALVKPVIQPGASAICALSALPSNITYGLTSGERGHFFYFHPGFGVTRVGALGSAAVGGGTLLQVEGGQIIGGWWGEEGGGLFRHQTRVEAGQGLEQFQGAVSPMENLPLPVAGEGIATLIKEPLDGVVYGLTHPGRALFCLDPDTGESKVVGRIEGASTAMAVTSEGALLGSFTEGQLWSYTTYNGLEALDAYVPCQMGKRYVAGAQSLVTARDGLIYGGTGIDGFLFTYDWLSGRVINLGKPNRQSNIRALVEGHDGLIYGIAEEPEGMAHLFTFDPRTRGFEDLGVVASAFLQYWPAHSLGAMCVGPFGEIFLGETDRISHLFIYYPPMLRPQDDWMEE